MQIRSILMASCLSVAMLGASATMMSSRAQAANTATATIAVTATVTSFCAIVATPLVFGNYTSSTALPGTATLTATCTFGTPYTIALNAGSTTGATITTRLMAGTASNTLGYSLYTDAGHTNLWGNGTLGVTVAGTGAVLPNVLTVYGIVPANQVPAPGAYTDTVTATLTY